MKILIFGAGAVGSLLGGFLAKAGHEVTLLGRSWHMDAVGKNGLEIKGIWGAHRIKSFRLYDKAANLYAESPRFDLIILTVKSFDTEKAVLELTPLISEKTVLVSFQNGLGNIEAILKKVEPERYLIGRIITGVDIVPGKIEVTVSADALAIGQVSNSPPIRSAELIADLFNQSSIPARAVPNILMLIWSKVIYNCALNGPCSILEIPYGGMLESAERIESMRKIVSECYEVGMSRGVDLEPDDAVWPSAGRALDRTALRGRRGAEKYMELLVNELIPKTAAHYPSMLGDLRKGRRTEINALNGAVCRFGQELNIPTPENQRITDLIRQNEIALRRRTGKI